MDANLGYIDLIVYACVLVVVCVAGANVLDKVFP